MPLTNLLKAPIVDLQNWVAASPTFQALVGAGNATEALESIYFQDAPGNWTSTRAIVGTKGGRSVTKTGTTTWSLNSPLFVVFEIDQSAYFTGGVINHNAAALNFMGQIEAILDDLLPLCGTTVDGVTFPDIVKVEETGAPLPFDPSENQGKYFWGTLWTPTIRG
jgi:hypothetical protein